MSGRVNHFTSKPIWHVNKYKVKTTRHNRTEKLKLNKICYKTTLDGEITIKGDRHDSTLAIIRVPLSLAKNGFKRRRKTLFYTKVVL